MVRLGDLCMSPFALDADCRKASWAQQCAGYPDVCSEPQETLGASSDAVFGELFLLLLLCALRANSAACGWQPPRLRELTLHERTEL